MADINLDSGIDLSKVNVLTLISLENHSLFGSIDIDIFHMSSSLKGGIGHWCLN